MSLTAGDLFRAGAMQRWVSVFQMFGGGAEGRYQANLSITRQYPGVRANTMAVIERESYASLAAARRFRTAGQDYELPVSAYADLSSYQRGAGATGQTMYGHRVRFQFTLTNPNGSTSTQTRTVRIESPRNLTYGQLQAMAQAEAQRQIAYELSTSQSMRGRTASTPFSLLFDSSYRFVSE